MSVGRLLPWIVLTWLLTGCSSTGSIVGDMLLYGPVGGATVYGNAQFDKLAEAGLYPPRGTVARCNREGLVRDASGGWSTDRTLVVACHAAAGWKHQPDGSWERL